MTADEISGYLSKLRSGEMTTRTWIDSRGWDSTQETIARFEKMLARLERHN